MEAKMGPRCAQDGPEIGPRASAVLLAPKIGPRCAQDRPKSQAHSCLSKAKASSTSCASSEYADSAKPQPQPRSPGCPGCPGSPGCPAATKCLQSPCSWQA